MKKYLTIVPLALIFLFFEQNLSAKEKIYSSYPIGEPGLTLTYSSIANDLPKSVVRNLSFEVSTQPPILQQTTGMIGIKTLRKANVES